jgi:hypothetical protein
MHAPVSGLTRGPGLSDDVNGARIDQARYGHRSARVGATTQQIFHKNVRAVYYDRVPHGDADYRSEPGQRRQILHEVVKGSLLPARCAVACEITPRCRQPELSFSGHRRPSCLAPTFTEALRLVFLAHKGEQRSREIRHGRVDWSAERLSSVPVEVKILVKLDRDAVTSSVPRSGMEPRLRLHTTESPIHVKDFDPQMLWKHAQAGPVELR